MRMLKTAHQVFLLLITTAVAMPVVGYSLESTTRVWTFDDDYSPETLPPEFRVGTLFDGRPAGQWKMLQTDQAKSPPRVLGQLMGKGAEHAYKTVLIETKASDIELEVSFLAIGGKADMGGGLIWRAADDRNYYLTRANPLEQNIRIYRVVKGIRQMLMNFDHIIDIRQWHTLRVIAKGCQVEVFFDEKPVFNLCDQTFKTGQIGLWTKSDAVTYFDDIRLKIVP